MINRKVIYAITNIEHLTVLKLNSGSEIKLRISVNIAYKGQVLPGHACICAGYNDYYRWNNLDFPYIETFQSMPAWQLLPAVMIDKIFQSMCIVTKLIQVEEDIYS